MADEVVEFDPKILAALLAAREDLSTKIPNLKALVYGESGVGKTVEIMKLAQAVTPNGKTIEFIDFLEGWVSILNHKGEGLDERTNRQQYEGISQIEFLGRAIKAKIPPFDSIGTVVLDEISSMTKGDLDVVLKARAALDSSKDPNAPTQPDFYSNTERCRRAVTILMQNDINVLFVAHIREDQLKNGTVITRPSFMPKFSEVFRQMLHLVTYLSAEEFINPEDGSTEYRRSFQVHPTRSISAKTRIGGLPLNVTSEVLAPAIIEWMQGKRKSEEVDEKTGENLVILPDSDVEIPVSEDVAVENE